MAARPSLTQVTGRGWVAAAGLAVVVLAAFAATAAYTQRFAGYVVMTDELMYVKQALRFWYTGAPTVAGDPWFISYAQLWPLLLALPYGLLPTPSAFDVAHVMQAAVMATTAVPVFLLARMVTDSVAGALVAAAISVAVPWMALSASLLTEPLAYALTAWAALACTRAIAAPSPRRDVVALIALLAVALARVQLVVLAPALAGAILLHEVLRARSLSAGARSALARHPVLGAALAVTAVLLAVTPGSLLGAYAVSVSGDLLPGATWGLAHEALASLLVGVAALPVALSLAWLAAVLGRRDTPVDAHAYGCFLAVAAPVLVLSTGSFLARYAPAVHDRYLCYLAPLSAVGMVGLLTLRRRALVATAAATVATAVLVGTATIALRGPTFISPTAAFNTLLDGRGYQLGRLVGADLEVPGLMAVLTLAGGAAVVVARALLPPIRAGLAAGVVILGCCALQTAYVFDKLAGTQRGVSPAYLQGRDWLDRAAPGDGRVGAVVAALFGDEARSTVPWWEVLFWNKRIDVAWTGPDAPKVDLQLGQRFDVEPATGRIARFDERPLLLLSAAERRFGLRGQRVVADVGNGFVVVDAGRPRAAAWTLQGADSNGRILRGRTGALRVFGDGEARERDVRLTLTPGTFATRGQLAEVTGPEGRVRIRLPFGGRRRATVAVPVPARGAVTLAIRPVRPLPGPGEDNGAGVSVAAVEVDDGLRRRS